MSTEYGKKLGKALEAVCRLHADTSKLLQDCDGTIGKGKKAIFGSYATRDLTWHVNAEFWMAEAVYRYYHDRDGSDPRVAEGITVSFFDPGKSVEEPLLLVAQLEYELGDNSIDRVCRPWDIWSAFFRWTNDRRIDEVLISKEADSGRVKWCKLVAIPLYSVTSMGIVTALMERVRRTNT